MTIATTLPILALGDTGSDVQWAQYLMVLKTLNHDRVDGVFGPVTDNAVREFQGYNDLEVDGIVGPLTWTALHSDKQRPPTLAQGSEGQLVNRH